MPCLPWARAESTPTDPRMIKAAEWMLKKQNRRKGDWSVKVPDAEPGGWYFEHNNEFYPDVDDTAQVLLALNHIETKDARFQSESVQRGIEWELAMQCKNGGWASFDKDNNRMVFQYVPFADHNAMLDPATVDITGRVLECLAAHGFTLKDKAGAARHRVHSQGAGVRRLVVRALGRQLHLRHHVRAARTGSHRL